MAPASECAVLVPVGVSIEPETNECLQALANLGYAVRFMRGSSQVDLARSTMAAEALRDGFKETLWVDSDQTFSPADVERIRSHGLPFVVGLYPRKGPKEFAAKFRPETKSVTFGVGGGLIEMEYAGFGFTHVRAEVYKGIREKVGVPDCNGGYGGKKVTPYFIPAMVPEGDGLCYLSEDFSFCHRARRAGFPPMADTTLKIGHIGKHKYTWDDFAPDEVYESMSLEINIVPATQENAA